MRLWKPHDPGRSCLPLTIRHHVANETDSQNDGALPFRVRAILLEGGPTLAGSFLAAGLIDQVVAYIAPVLIGGGGKPALAGPGAPNIADAKRFRLEDVVRIGPDVRLTATPLR